MQANDTKHIKIGLFIQELWHFKDNKVKLEWDSEMEIEWNRMEWDALK